MRLLYQRFGAAAAAALLTAPLTASAQPDIGSITLPYTVTGGGYLGSGVNISAPSTTLGECVRYAKSETDTTGATSTVANISVVSQYDMYSRDTVLDLGFQSTAKAAYAGISADTKFKLTGKYADFVKREGNSVAVMFNASSDNGRLLAVDYALKDEYKNLLASSPGEFRERCGTHFIRGIHKVADATVIVRIDGLSDSGKNALELTLEKTVGGGFDYEGLKASGSSTVTTSYKQVVEFAKRQSKVNISFKAIGGPGLAAAGQAINATDPADLKAISTAMSQAVSQFTGANAAPLEYILVPYTVFGAEKIAYDPELIEKVGKLTEQLVRVSEALERIEGYKKRLPNIYKKYFINTEASLRTLKADLISRVNTCAKGGACERVNADVLSNYVFLEDVFSSGRAWASCSYQPAGKLLSVSNAKIDPRVLETVTVNFEGVAPHYDALDFSSVKILRFSEEFDVDDVSDQFIRFSKSSSQAGMRMFGSIYFENLKTKDVLIYDKKSNGIDVDRIALSKRRDKVLNSMYVIEVAGAQGGQRYGYSVGFPDRQSCKQLVLE